MLLGLFLLITLSMNRCLLVGSLEAENEVGKVSATNPVGRRVRVFAAGFPSVIGISSVVFVLGFLRLADKYNGSSWSLTTLPNKSKQIWQVHLSVQAPSGLTYPHSLCTASPQPRQDPLTIVAFSFLELGKWHRLFEAQ
jgi:hypothetical protein